MLKKVAKVVGIITVAPFISVLVTTWLWVFNRSYFANNLNWYWFSVGFLTLIPISAYLLQYAIPSVRSQGRVGERKLAFIMFVASYFAGSVLSLCLQAPILVECILCSYFLSGFILMLTNKFLHFEASGHACGVVGPLTFLAYFIQGVAFFTLLIVPLVFWARIKQGRHTMSQLVVGGLTSLIPAIIMIFIYNRLM